MRVLFVVPYVPSLIRVRPFQFVQGLARRGHDITLAAPSRAGEERDGLQIQSGGRIRLVTERLGALRCLWNCVRAVPSRLPFQAVYAWNPVLSQMIATEVRHQQYDVIHVEHLRGAVYGTRLIRERDSLAHACQARVPIVWDSVDCISYLFRQAQRHSLSLATRLLTRIELPRTEPYEAWLTTQFDRVLVTSPADRRALQQLCESHRTPLTSKLAVLCNGVDLDYFHPTNVRRDPATLVFVGKMSYHANVTAVRYLVEDVMPLIWAVAPEVKLLIVGKDPPNAVKSLETRDTGGTSAHSAPRVIVTGTVRDVRPFLWQATAAVAPLIYGAGVQNKVLEAMACGTPVVATRKAVSSLNVRAGEDFLLADTPTELAQSVLTLLSNKHLQHRLAQNGLRYVSAFHSWDTVTASLETIYAEVIKARAEQYASV